MKKSCDGIIGLAIGDAMGVPLESMQRDKLLFSPVTTMKGNIIHGVPKGSFSDDTSMTIATIDSVISKGKIDISDIANNFLKWIKKCEYTSYGYTFGIGRTTFQALANCEKDIQNAHNAGGTEKNNNGNGSLMRILPVAYYCYAKKQKEDEILDIVKRVSSITHAHEISIMGCYIYVMYALELLNGKDKLQAYQNIKEIDYSMFSLDTINIYDRVLKGDIKNLKMEDISSSGYVVSTLEASLWVLLNTQNYNQAIIGAINLGDDTDTVGACTGGLAGIIYGIETINEEWKKDLLRYDYICNLCDKFDETIYKSE